MGLLSSLSKMSFSSFVKCCPDLEICIKSRECLLGEISDGKLEPSLYGRVVEQCWTALARHFQNIELDSYAIMPNHLHGVIVITGRGKAFSSQSQQGRKKSSENALPLPSIHGTQQGSLAAVVQNFKSISTLQSFCHAVL